MVAKQELEKRNDWKVTANFIVDTKQYAVYRLRDVNATDHSGNREYATDFMDSREEAQQIADRMNKKESPVAKPNDSLQVVSL